MAADEAPVYVDTSAVAAVLMREPGEEGVRAVLSRASAIYSAPLLEAELRSLFRREGLDPELLRPTFDGISWVIADRRLTPEMLEVQAAGHVRGADLWHLAHAMFLAGRPQHGAFLTLDQRQRQLATQLGFIDPLSR